MLKKLILLAIFCRFSDESKESVKDLEKSTENRKFVDIELAYDHSIYEDYGDNDEIILTEIPKIDMCYFESNWYRDDEKFRWGPKGCAECVCVNAEVTCQHENCKLSNSTTDSMTDSMTTENFAKIKFEETEITSIEEVTSAVGNGDVHNQYQTTELLINCCNIGTFISNCSDSGIDNTMVNPPTGLCRSTIKHCCMLKNRDYFDQYHFTCDPQNAEHLTCCAVCKVVNVEPTDAPAYFKSLVSQCCTTPNEISAQPLRKHEGKNLTGACMVGNMWNSELLKCEDIDECRINMNGCCDEQDCVNTDGGYHCVPKGICRHGYRFNEDMMECQTNDSTFNFEDAETIKQINCLNGYEYDEELVSCVDIDECLKSPCQHSCVNLYGSYRCECKRGFRVNGNLCDDVDECERSPCSNECINVVGSYRCQCPHGMVLGVDKKKCVEKNLNATCPAQYKVHKTPEDKDFLKCVRLPCETDVESCKKIPKYLTYKSLTIPKNFVVLKRGFQIFNIKTKSMKVAVEHKIKINVEHKGKGVRAASLKDFSANKEPNRLLVMLTRQLRGPQSFSVIVNLVKDTMKDMIMESVEIKIVVE